MAPVHCTALVGHSLRFEHATCNAHKTLPRRYATFPNTVIGAAYGFFVRLAKPRSNSSSKARFFRETDALHSEVKPSRLQGRYTSAKQPALRGLGLAGSDHD